MHVHDLQNYLDVPEGTPGHTFTHTIHQLRFGPQIPDDVTQKLAWERNLPSTNHHVNPLDSTEQLTDDPAFNYMYFVKVVSTSYLPLSWRAKKGGLISGGQGEDNSALSDILPVGSHGRGEDGSLETHQYSVTSHKRSLSGGSDAQDGHKERLHARYAFTSPFPFLLCSHICCFQPILLEVLQSTSLCFYPPKYRPIAFLGNPD